MLKARSHKLEVSSQSRRNLASPPPMPDGRARAQRHCSDGDARGPGGDTALPCNTLEQAQPDQISRMLHGRAGTSRHGLDCTCAQLREHIARRSEWTPCPAIAALHFKSLNPFAELASDEPEEPEQPKELQVEQVPRKEIILRMPLEMFI